MDIQTSIYLFLLFFQNVDTVFFCFSMI